MKNTLLLLLITFSSIAQQTRIKGTVIDEKTKEILPFVSIFIGNTTKGTSSNEAGEFVFSNLPIGSYNVVASMVGYISKSTPIVVKEENSVLEITISLVQNEQILTEVSVKSSKDKVWDNNLKRFKNIFFGTSDNAKKSRILNPYVIDFEEKDGIFFAKSSTPIIIENLALGYKLTFVMKAFEVSKTDFLIAGDTFFEEILASPKEKRTWEENRLDAYKGSINHFLQSLARHTSTQNGFNVYTYKNARNITKSFVQNIKIEESIIKLNPDSLIAKDGTMTYLNLSKNIEIHYTQKEELGGPYTDITHQISQFESRNKFIRFNRYGLFENPFDVYVVGSFSNLRIAELLPIDFQPKIEELIAQTQVSNSKSNYAPQQEKIVFHVNKSNYFLGETVWFKTYLTYTSVLYQDAISKVVYVDLIDEAQKIIKSKILKAKNGVAHGDFVIPDTLKNGNYFLRAYTNWQQNFGDSTQTVQEIAVLKKNQSIDSQITGYQSVDERIGLNKTSFSLGENVEINLNGIANHSFSVSITNENNVKVYIPIQESTFTRKIIELERINYNSETGRTFIGSTQDTKGRPIEAELILMRKDTFLLDSYNANKDGVFKIENITGNDTLVIDILANDKKGKPVSNVFLEEPAKPKFYFPKTRNNFKMVDNQAITSNSSVSYDYDFDLKNSILLQEVNVKAKKPDTTMLLRFHKIFGKPAYEFTDKKYNFNGKLNFIQTIQGKVPGLNIKFDGATGVMDLTWNRGRTPEIWVDGVQMKSINETIIDPDMISRIEVYQQNRSVVFPSGMIAIFTKNFVTGEDLTFTDTPTTEGIKRFKMIGFYTPKKFYLPENETDATKMFQLKNRSTIYWNPAVLTDDKGKAKISFQAIGKPGNYRIEVIGYNEKGKITKIERGFSIK